MSRDRPTFVLPWIVVVLSVFAFLPPWMGRSVSDPVGSVADADVSDDVDPSAHTTGLEAGSLEEEERSYPIDESALASEVLPVELLGVATAASVDPVTAEVSEAGFQPEVEAPAEPMIKQIEDREFQSLTPGSIAILAGGSLPVEATPTRRGSTRSASTRSSDDLLAVLQEHAPLRPDGRVELRLSIAALNFLRQERLLPTEVAVVPVVVEAAARELRSEREVAETGESEEASRKLRLKTFLRKMRTDPRQAASMLALLEPFQLRELARQLNARGVDARTLVFNN